MELQEAEFHKSATELKITARVNQYYILGDKGIYIELITMVETRLRKPVKGFRPIYKLQAGRGTPRQSQQNQPIRSLEVGSRRAHETRIFFVSVGFDTTRKGVMEPKKPSKVVFLNGLIRPRQCIVRVQYHSQCFLLPFRISCGTIFIYLVFKENGSSNFYPYSSRFVMHLI